MDKKHEDVAMVAQIDKTSVCQEGRVAPNVAVRSWGSFASISNELSADNFLLARVFNQSPISPRKCRVVRVVGQWYTHVGKLTPGRY